MILVLVFLLLELAVQLLVLVLLLLVCMLLVLLQLPLLQVSGGLIDVITGGVGMLQQLNFSHGALCMFILQCVKHSYGNNDYF